MIANIAEIAALIGAALGVVVAVLSVVAALIGPMTRRVLAPVHEEVAAIRAAVRTDDPGRPSIADQVAEMSEALQALADSQVVHGDDLRLLLAWKDRVDRFAGDPADFQVRFGELADKVDEIIEEFRHHRRWEEGDAVVTGKYAELLAEIAKLERRAHEKGD